ncbi:1,4-alpha-glucan branching enzyme [Hymenobacter luteus]|uniref:1,4-alpha-glucan branching enzyme n=2 Tax=Hymenobacter TaxID=89966 RepID=A0A7W9T5L3_9BACT|nr:MULTISPECIES: alpha-amylase family glycosyl hydrolase [Hymenobacter]MBB4602952.1 1,4-alpha-glucan branching enzyme [Hymenobacter latericoloratus]MBB6060844.1 1,4-alpha-glucan branching enzyme [Hymenobacter luteus]
MPATDSPSAPVLQAGMGALPHENGTTFRVWAPAATAVALVGPFNDWDSTTHPLTLEADGYWAADFPDLGPGTEYKFHLATPTGELQRNDPYAREVTHSAGNSVVPDPTFEWEDDQFQMPAWNELVIYELHVGTFHAPDPTRPGNFYDAIEKLDYLENLGINAVEIMPATEFPGSLSWGYNPAHPFAIETDYGGAMAFKEFIKAAHRRGIAVILDVVYNHFGPGDLDLWQFDGWSENDGGGIYFYNDWRAETPWGHNRPDYGRDAVRRYIRDNALMWLEEYRVDGLRCDAIAHIRNVDGTSDASRDLPEGWSLMRWINEEIRATMPWKITIAEDLLGNEYITRAPEHDGQGFSAQWDAGFVYPIRDALVTPEDADRNMEAVAQAIRNVYNGDAFQRVIYTESHDEVANGKARVTEEIMPGNAASWFPKKRSTLGAALVFTVPGIPMIFQGQTMLADGSFSDDQPLDWSRAETHAGLVRLYQDLIGLRRNLSGHTRGLLGQSVDISHLNNDDKILAFIRRDQGGPGDTTVVLCNFADRAHPAYTIGLPRGGHWRVRFNSDWEGYDQEFGNFESIDTQAEDGVYDDQPFHGTFGLAPYSVLIISQEPE